MRKAKSKPYVEYDHNNSGGRWWLSDENWHALEKAGWKVHWATLEHAYTDDGDYIREPDGTPKLILQGAGNSRYNIGSFARDGRFLGSLATKAYKVGAKSVREAADEWERITGLSALAAGCACCGQPHNFTLYDNGKQIESGPTARYEAAWS